MSPEKGPREAILIARPAGVPLKMAAKLREPSEQAYLISRSNSARSVGMMQSAAAVSCLIVTSPRSR
jgi:hypothetical protein